MEILSANQLVKTYSRRRVVDGVSLEVRAGARIGFSTRSRCHQMATAPQEPRRWHGLPAATVERFLKAVGTGQLKRHDATARIQS